MAAAADMKGVVGENLRKALDWLPQGRRLVTVATDCDLTGHVLGWPEFDALALREIDAPALLAFYERYGFERDEARARGLARRSARTNGDRRRRVLPRIDLPDRRAVGRHRHALRGRHRRCDALDAWIGAGRGRGADRARHRDRFARRRCGPRLIGMSLAVAPPARRPTSRCATSYAGAPDQLPVAEVLERAAGPGSSVPTRPKVGQNTKYDAPRLRRRRHRRARLLRTTPCSRATCSRRTGRTAWRASPFATSAAPASPTRRCAARAPTRSRSRRSRSGRSRRLRLRGQRDGAARAPVALAADRGPRPGCCDVYRDIEMPTSAVLAPHRAGRRADRSASCSRAQSHELAERMLALEHEAHALAGQPFNLGSPKQIGEILFGKLGLPVRQEDGERRAVDRRGGAAGARRRLPAAGASCSSTASLSKLKGTYTDKLPLMVNPTTGRVHTNYAQAVAVTGRLSSNDPNLQNIPIRTRRGPAHPRSLHRPARRTDPVGRLLADRAAHHGPHLGRRRPAAAFGARHRRAPGDGGRGVRRRRRRGLERAAPLRQGHQLRPHLRHERVRPGRATSASSAAPRPPTSSATSPRYPGVKRYMDETRAAAREKGYVETLFGRRVYLPDINGRRRPARAAPPSARRSTRRCRAPRPT